MNRLWLIQLNSFLLLLQLIVDLKIKRFKKYKKYKLMSVIN